MYKVLFSKQGRKDAVKIERNHLCETHRFVYELRVNENHDLDNNNEPYEGIVWVLSMWTHYKSIKS